MRFVIARLMMAGLCVVALCACPQSRGVDSAQSRPSELSGQLAFPVVGASGALDPARQEFTFVLSTSPIACDDRGADPTSTGLLVGRISGTPTLEQRAYPLTSVGPYAAIGTLVSVNRRSSTTVPFELYTPVSGQFVVTAISSVSISFRLDLDFAAAGRLTGNVNVPLCPPAAKAVAPRAP